MNTTHTPHISKESKLSKTDAISTQNIFNTFQQKILSIFSEGGLEDEDTRKNRIINIQREIILEKYGKIIEFIEITEEITNILVGIMNEILNQIEYENYKKIYFVINKKNIYSENSNFIKVIEDIFISIFNIYIKNKQIICINSNDIQNLYIDEVKILFIFFDYMKEELIPYYELPAATKIRMYFATPYISNGLINITKKMPWFNKYNNTMVLGRDEYERKKNIVNLYLGKIVSDKQLVVEQISNMKLLDIKLLYNILNKIKVKINEEIKVKNNEKKVENNEEIKVKNNEETKVEKKVENNEETKFENNEETKVENNEESEVDSILDYLNLYLDETLSTKILSDKKLLNKILPNSMSTIVSLRKYMKYKEKYLNIKR
jgi:hypothetical protein